MAALLRRDAARLTLPAGTTKLRAHLAWQTVEPGHLDDPPRIGRTLGEIELQPATR